MSSATECAAPPLAGDLFVPLVVYFFVTLAAGALGGSYLAVSRWRRAKGGGGSGGGYGDGAADGFGGGVLRGGGGGGLRGSGYLADGGDYGDGVVATGAAAAAAAAAGGVTGKESWAIAFKELRFGRRIGAGNVGEVYRGVFRGRPVAIKRLLSSWTADEGMIARFREEILLMSTMNHPNVLGFVGAVLDRDAGNIALVTELCERGTLSDLLHHSDEPLPWGRRLKMARDIAMGMDYLHTKAGVIQRDLKAANLLVTRAYDVRVADFGLSRELAPGRMGTYCGTPSTMAPEVVRQEEYSEKADVFSFAIILWELLTREEPYAGHDGLALAYAVANDGLRPPVPACCPAEWAAMMVRSWDDNPALRPSFDELQRELLRLIRLLEAPPPGVRGKPAAALTGTAGGGGGGDGGQPAPSSPVAASGGGVDARGRFRLPAATPGPGAVATAAAAQPSAAAAALAPPPPAQPLLQVER